MLNPLESVGTSPFAAAASASFAVGGDDFFRLITAQLASQDPLEPVDEAQFMGQLAQFAQLEETTTTNQTLAQMVFLQENLAALQQLTQGTELLGQRVEYTDSETGEKAEGTVQAIRVEDGLVVADVDGTSVPLIHLTAILGS